MCTSPGVDVHQQQQSLHRDHVYPLAVRPGHPQNLQVGEAQHEQAEREAAAVEQRREGRVGGEPRPLPRVQVDGAGGVRVAVAPPVHQQLGEGEGEGLQPGVRHDEERVPVAHLAGVAEREHHRHPPVHAERGHAQHRVSGEESLRKADGLAERVPEGLRARGHPEERGGHVDEREEDVGEGEVEDEDAGHVGAQLGALGET